jgi:hypothetical protein
MNGSGINVDRDVPQFEVPRGTTLVDWVKEHPAELCNEIVVSAKWAKDIPADRIPVLMLVEPDGVHLFQIGMREGIIESLEKAQEFFVKTEMYEMAAECRDLYNAYVEEFKQKYDDNEIH